MNLPLAGIVGVVALEFRAQPSPTQPRAAPPGRPSEPIPHEGKKGVAGIERCGELKRHHVGLVDHPAGCQRAALGLVNPS
jgi:hypothetical protein